MFDRLKNKRPVLFWSGGLDSTLLLAMLREQNNYFDIVQMREFWTREQRKRADKLIALWNLKVFSYPPMSINLIGNGDEISVIQEFAVKGGRVPMAMDVIEGDRCLVELQGQRMNYPPMDWDLVLVGSRRDDTHYALNTLIPSETWQIGETEFYAPFYHWSRDAIKRELKARGLDADEVSDEVDSGNLSFCTNCLHGKDSFCPIENQMIPPVQWSGENNLAAFRAAYQN